MNSTRIQNALVFESCGRFVQKDICMEDGLFTGTPSGNSSCLDASGLYAIPGLTDIHFHGCAGYDFCDGSREAFSAIGNYQLKHGITTIMPATMSYSEEILSPVLKEAGSYESHAGSILCGIRLEGPFLSPAKKGAQNEAYLKAPDPALFLRLQKASGWNIRLVDLAPELDGAMEFIRLVRGKAVISLAHTEADYSTASLAYEQGASHTAHLFNAMPPFSHRAPGVIGAAFDHKNVTVELICDGVHLHPCAVRAAFRLFGDQRICLISDSMMATGLPDGTYQLGGQEVSVRGPVASLRDGTLAGSVTNLMDCLRILVLSMGIPLESAVTCAAVTPAKVAGVYDQYGSIAPGKVANLVLLDQKLQIRAVFLRGRKTSL